MQAGLEGRTALVTGASSGLGRHFAQVLARHGAQVVLAARRRDRLDELAGVITAAGGVARTVALDVSDAGSVRAAVAEAGPVDILVNNAGAALGKGFLELSEAEWDAILDVNLKGCFLVAQAVARGMVEAGRPGSIVNVASILGLRVAAQVVPYAASKAGLVRMTEAMALELARHRIRVNALCPGYVETDLNREFFASPAGAALVKRIPQRRLGRLEDLDGALLLLCSEAGAYITGSALVVDGGHLVSTL